MYTRAVFGIFEKQPNGMQANNKEVTHGASHDPEGD